MATVRLSVGWATGSHVAGAGHQARSPGPNACERLYPPAVDGHGAHGLRVFARRTHAHHTPRAPESVLGGVDGPHSLQREAGEAGVSGVGMGRGVCEAGGARAGERTRVCGAAGANEPGWAL